MHVTYVPFIKAAGELKTKPTQQSVAKLREIGIAPHMLVCRCEKPLNKDLRQKISLFCNVPVEAVIEEKDVEHRFTRCRSCSSASALDDLVCRLLRLDAPLADMTHWQEIIRKLIAPQHRVRIGVVGKYIELQDAYKSVYEAIIHGGIANDCGVEIVRVDAEEIEKEGADKILKGLGGILVPGGFGERGIEGKIKAAQYARENKVPYLGLCLGMQIATIEFARNVLKLDKAHSTEFDPNTPHPVIAMLDEQKKVTKKGGTMRLGAQPCQLVARHERRRNSTARSSSTNATGTATNSTTPTATNLKRRGSCSAALSPDGKLVEVIELARPSVFRRQPVSPGVFEQAAPAAPAVQGLHRRRARAGSPEADVNQIRVFGLEYDPTFTVER